MNRKTIKQWFFRTCPRSGRILGLNRDNLWLNGEEVAPQEERRVVVGRTTPFELTAQGRDGRRVSQRLLVRSLQRVAEYLPGEARTGAPSA